MYFEAYFHSNL